MPDQAHANNCPDQAHANNCALSNTTFKIFYGRADAVYKEPIEFSIAQIPAILTTMHNEAVIGWSQIPIHKGSPAVLIHIDRHADMEAGAVSWEGRNETRKRLSRPEITFKEFIKDYVQITNFISYAIHQGIVGVVYWWNPKEETVACYGRIVDGKHVDPPRTVLKGGEGIYWDVDNFNREVFGDVDNLCKPPLDYYYEYKRKERISLNDFIRDLKGYTGPSILDWDLDSIISAEDPEWNDGLNDTRSIEDGRFEEISKVVRELPPPASISITTSQYPKVFVPQDKVERFVTEAKRILEESYNEVRSSGRL